MKDNFKLLSLLGGKMKAVKLIVFCIIVSLIGASQLKADKDKPLGKAMFVLGKVKFVNTNKSKSKLRKNQVFYGGEAVITSKGSIAKIRLSNGSIIKVMPSSTIIVNKIQSKGGNKYAFGVVKGGLRSKVNKLTKGRDYYRVFTPSAVAGVRGTEFIVSVGVNGRSNVMVKEGKISLQGEEQKSSVKGGEKAEVSLNDEIEKEDSDSDLDDENKEFQKKNRKIQRPVKSIAIAADKLRMISIRNRRRVRELRKAKQKRKLTVAERNELEFLYQRSVNQGEAWYSLSHKIFKKYRSNRLMAKKIKGKFYLVQKNLRTINDHIKDMDDFIDQISKQIDKFVDDTGKDIDDLEKNFMGND